MAKDLRTWIEDISALPGELTHVHPQVNPAAFESSALLEVLDRANRQPAVLFENPLCLAGSQNGFRLLMNAVATNEKIGTALGLKEISRRAIMERYALGEANPRAPEVIRPSEAPVKEVVWTGEQVDLRMLPIPRINEMDGAPYLTPVVVTRDPANDRYNVSWNRCMFIDRNHLAIWMSPRHLWTLQTRIEQDASASLPVALVLGHHPAFCLVAAGLTKLDKDELEVCGGVLGEPVRVVPSEVYGDSLWIPADAEIVLEGEVLADKRSIEGPFGEFTGYEGPQRLAWVIEIKAISARSEGILMCVFGGHQENLYAHYPIQADIYANLRNVFPGVQDLSWVDSGAPLQCVISMKKKTEGEPMRVAMHALSLSNFFKHVIVVDDDIDPGNAKQVMWAVATRVQADKDVNILRGVQGQVLDPSLEAEISGSAMIIDATKPTDRPFSQRAHPPEEKVRAVDLRHYFG